jgi:hypothetical protein
VPVKVVEAVVLLVDDDDVADALVVPRLGEGGRRESDECR